MLPQSYQLTIKKLVHEQVGSDIWVMTEIIILLTNLQISTCLDHNTIRMLKR